MVAGQHSGAHADAVDRVLRGGQAGQDDVAHFLVGLTSISLHRGAARGRRLVPGRVAPRD